MSLDINNYYDKNNPYSELWKNVEPSKLPKRLNKLITMEWLDFYQKFHLNCADNYSELFNSLQDGNIYILKNTFEGKFLGDLKSYVIKES